MTSGQINKFAFIAFNPINTADVPFDLQQKDHSALILSAHGYFTTEAFK